MILINLKANSFNRYETFLRYVCFEPSAFYRKASGGTARLRNLSVVTLL